MKKVIGVILALIILFLVGVKIINSPHSMTTQQILQKFDWHLQSKSDKKALGSVRFSKNIITITKGDKSTRNVYSVDDNDNVKINSGNYAGTYSIDMDSTDYSLSPKDNSKEKLELIRN